MERRSLVNKFFEENGLVEHHISSYNSFIENGLQSVIDEIGVINPDIEGFEVRLDGIRVGKPSIKEATGAVRQIFPNEARLRDLTYASPLILELTPIQNEVEQPKMEVPIGSLPTMLRSKICNLYGMDRDELIGVNEDPNDPGGYFVVNGTERVLILVEDLAPNLMNVSHVKLGPTTESARVFSEGGWYRRRNSVSRKKDGGLIMEMPPFSKPVPFIAVLKALGMEKDSDIVKEIASNPSLASELYVSFEEAEEAKNRNDALDLLGKKVAFGQEKEARMERAERVLDTFLLPHIGTMPEDRIYKAVYLCRMANKVIRLHLNMVDVDDKDHYSNKRLGLAGSLLEDLFRVAFRALVNNTTYSLEKAYKRNRKLAIRNSIRSNFLTERIQHAVATGAWIGSRQGVSQNLDRMNFISSISHRRRVRSLLSTTQPHFEARDLHSTHWGRLCPSETPEGSNIGLVKNLALTTKLTTESDDALIEETLRKRGVKRLE